MCKVVSTSPNVERILVMVIMMIIVVVIAIIAMEILLMR